VAKKLRSERGNAARSHRPFTYRNSCQTYAVEKMNIASTVCEMRTQF